MARVKGGVVTRRRHNKILKFAKGFTGEKSKLFRRANEAVMHSFNYAYRDRRAKKRDFRRLWIARINAAARMNGISYSVLMNGLKKANVNVNRQDACRHSGKGPERVCRDRKSCKAAA